MPELRSLANDIEADLALLELKGLDTTRTAAGDPEARQAICRIDARSHGALCMSFDLHGEQTAGIQIQFGYGHVRTGQPETLVERIQLWLNSRLSDNLRLSLRNAVADQRDGVLVFDSATEPEYRSVQDRDYLPSTPLELGDNIDELWCIFGPTLLRYSVAAGWRRAHRT